MLPSPTFSALSCFQSLWHPQPISLECCRPLVCAASPDCSFFLVCCLGLLLGSSSFHLLMGLLFLIDSRYKSVSCFCDCVVDREKMLLLLNPQPTLCKCTDGRVRMFSLWRGLNLPAIFSDPLMASQHSVLSLSGSLGSGA